MYKHVREDFVGIASRLAIPRLRPDRIRRPRVIDLLERSSKCRLIFIQAPAGFGKTTLIADWLAASKRRFIWLGVEREESYTDAFLVRLDAAIEATLGRGSPRSTPLSRRGMLLSAVSRITDLGEPLVLVIDDFHNLGDSSGQSLVAELCGLLPPDACVVAASREGIPFPAALLRARGELAEIGVDELRFTSSEVREFLARSSLTRLSDEETSALDERTEGWIAGLQLAVLALRDGRDPGRFLADFGGTSRDVYDFLAEEALAALPRSDLDFLTASSVVDRFCAPLCAALTGLDSARETLLRLERDCLFMVPLDEERSWYRLHTLFREALLGRLRAVDAGREREFRLMASIWLEAKGFQADALRQAVLAGDGLRAGILAEDFALAALERGDISELREGFEALGSGETAAGPWFRVAAGWAASYAGELGTAMSRAAEAEAAAPDASMILAKARDGLCERFRTTVAVEPFAAEELLPIREKASLAAAEASPDQRRLAGQIETLRAYVAWLQAESRVSLDRAVRALEILPAEELVARCHAEMTLGYSFYMQAADCLCDPAFDRAMDLARRAGVLHVRYLAAAGRANLKLALGDLEGAKAICLAATLEPDSDRYPALGDVFVILSQVEWERDEIGAALDAGRRGLELCLRWGQADSLVSAYVTLATAHSAAGDSEAGLELLAHASRLEAVSTWHKLNIDEAMASIELERGNRAGADAFCSKSQPIRTYEGYYTLAHWLILRRRAAEALPYLEQMREKGEKRRALPRLADGYILLALAAKSRGERDKARAWMEKAIAISAPGGYVRRFIRRGEGIAELLRERQSAQPDRFVARLLEAFAADAGRRAGKARTRRAECGARTEASAMILSPRELEVLRYLGAGLTAEEIAAKSFVAPSTVRSHIKSIYGKLGVHRRVEAIRRAGELSLL